MLESLSIEINKPAPDFTLTDIFDRKITLSDYRGKKVLLGFFRHAGCPFCNIRVHRLQRKTEEFRAVGLEMIFFFESAKETLLAQEFHQKVSPIPLIADPQKVWYHNYGIENAPLKSTASILTTFLQTSVRAKLAGVPNFFMKGKESISTMPAEFLIDEKGIIRTMHYAKSLNDRLHLETVSAFAHS